MPHIAAGTCSTWPNQHELALRIEAMRPSAIVNAAGYTAVDKAESEAAVAWRINAESVATAACLAIRLDVPFIHVSTDYVFDGRKSSEYVEDDATLPVNVYGATKLPASWRRQSSTVRCAARHHSVSPVRMYETL